MQRKNFRVTCPGHPVVVKHTWNAAIQAVADAVRTIARDEGQTYSLVSSTSEKSDGFHHDKGSRTWRGDKTGATLVFTIQQID